MYSTVVLQYSPLITSHTHGIFCVGHAWLWCLPHSIAAWATPAFRRGPHAWHFLLPATRGLSTFIIKPMFLSLLCMYNLIRTLHTCSFNLLFVSFPHRMTLITSIPHRQLVWREISASNTYTCTMLLCYHALYSILTRTSPLLSFVEVKNSSKLSTYDLQLYAS